MGSLALLLFQSASVAAPAGAAADCAASGTEIVVCGRRTDQDRYRLPRLSDRYEERGGPPRAEWSLGAGVRAGVAASRSTLPQGAVSPRIMATVKVPF